MSNARKLKPKLQKKYDSFLLNKEEIMSLPSGLTKEYIDNYFIKHYQRTCDWKCVYCAIAVVEQSGHISEEDVREFDAHVKGRIKKRASKKDPFYIKL